MNRRYSYYVLIVLEIISRHWKHSKLCRRSTCWGRKQQGPARIWCNQRSTTGLTATDNHVPSRSGVSLHCSKKRLLDSSYTNPPRAFFLHRNIARHLLPVSISPLFPTRTNSSLVSIAVSHAAASGAGGKEVYEMRRCAVWELWGKTIDGVLVEKAGI